MNAKWSFKPYNVRLGLSGLLVMAALLALSLITASNSQAAPLPTNSARPLNTNVSGVITQSTIWTMCPWVKRSA